MTIYLRRLVYTHTRCCVCILFPASFKLLSLVRSFDPAESFVAIGAAAGAFFTFCSSSPAEAPVMLLLCAVSIYTALSALARMNWRSNWDYSRGRRVALHRVACGFHFERAGGIVRDGLHTIYISWYTRCAFLYMYNCCCWSISRWCSCEESFCYTILRVWRFLDIFFFCLQITCIL